MSDDRKDRTLIWVGWIVFATVITVMAIYLVSVGLDKADKVASGAALIVGLLALGAPYLLPPKAPPPREATAVIIKNTGAANAGPGSEVVTGLRASASLLGGGSITVSGTGDATASDGGRAVTGGEFI